MPFSPAIVRAAACAALLVPSVVLAQRGPAAGPPRDPMQELLPLKPTRTLTFTTKVGNWISSDVSPDGKTIVFDLLGDLYTMPVTGGKATAFTRGMGFDGQPRFSPDGKKIVYVSDRTGGYNLWTISVDKKDTVQITTGNATTYQSPAWTPDGKYIIASRANRLWLFPATGGAGMQLIRDSAAAGGGGAGAANVTREEGPAFGKDPRYIYFAQRRGSWVYNTPLGDYALMQYDRETGRVISKENRWGSAFRPTLSPDGKWLVYGTRYVDHTRLRLRNLATNEEEWLTGPVQRDDQESRATLDVYPGMSFTPDSKFLVTTYEGKLWKLAVDTKQATEIPFDADVVQALGPHVGFDYRIPDSATFVAKQIRDATPSPDGKKLAFVALDRLYVMDYPNGTPKRLTNVNRGEFEPTWSPDGQWIAYTTWDDSIGYLNRMRSDGSGRPQRLTPQEGLWTSPVYTPNGQRILATRTPSRGFRTGGGGGGGAAGGRGGGGGDLMWLPAAGGAATFIATAPGDVHFSARDTSRIFAYNGQRGLYSMRWDGTDIKEILRIQGAPLPGAPAGGGRGAGASWAQISPDGQKVLAQVGLDLFYIPDIPWPGGAEPTITVGGGGGGGDGAAGGGQAFPSRKLTDIGAQFPQWGTNSVIRWSIGNAHVVYDVDRATAFDDSVRRANPPSAVAAGTPDSAAGAPAAGRGGRGGRPPLATYKPVETRIRVMGDRDIPRATAVLRGARIITMNGAEVIEKGDIVIVDNRISAVGPSGTLTVPAGAREIDVTGKTISPGFVDTHAHLRVANNVHRDPVWSYAANLAYGVTTARDPQTGSTDVLSYEDQEKAGKVLAPRIYSTGPGVFAAENIRSLDDARRVLKRYAEYYDTKTIKEYQTGNREVRQWVIQAANELKLMPTTEGGLDYKMNITEAIDGYSGHEHTIPTYPLQSDVIRLLSESGIAYTPTIIVAYGAPWGENYWYEKMDMLNDAKLQLFTPWSDLEGKILRRGGSPGAVTTMGQAGWFHDTQYPMKLVGGDIKRLVDAGGSAGVGSHGQQQGLGYHWELWNIGMGDGMTRMDALKIATKLGAEALGLGKDVGSLEVGKMADLLVFDRNPLENLQNTLAIKYVMKNGRLYDASNLDEVYPRKVKGAPFPWNEDESPTRDKLMKP